MPIYMDVHIVPGVKALDGAEAHHLDLMIQQEHGCKCLTYWLDEERGNVFCLIEAPTKEAVVEMHTKAHGLVPHKIIEVNGSLVESFLGRIYDPSNARLNEKGLKVFNDPSFRIILMTKTADPVLMKHTMGEEKANALLAKYRNTVRSQLLEFGGREVEHEGSSFVVSFTSAKDAISCALQVLDEVGTVTDNGQLELTIAVAGGEPVEETEQLFGSTLKLANYMCSVADNSKVMIASSVKELVAKDFDEGSRDMATLSPQEESLLQLLFVKLEENWQDPDFDMAEYCQATIMSKSQLYRRSMAFTGLSPNSLLKDFRLNRAKELMKKKRYNISQITFETGFTSPSYFTKCFKRKFGLLPIEYIDLLH